MPQYRLCFEAPDLRGIGDPQEGSSRAGVDYEERVECFEAASDGEALSKAIVLMHRLAFEWNDQQYKCRSATLEEFRPIDLSLFK